jgi:CrcB protein
MPPDHPVPDAVPEPPPRIRRRDPFPGLPVDPDLADIGLRDAAGVRHRGTPAPHTDPRLVALVLLGGAVGAPIRYLIARTWVTGPHAFPWSTFTINVVGAFALGLLLEFLARSGTDRGARRNLRLFVGTGVLGAFTTYSTFAVEADLLVRTHADGLAAAYAVGSVAAGLLASLAGIVVAAGGHRALAGDRSPADGSGDGRTGGRR